MVSAQCEGSRRPSFSANNYYKSDNRNCRHGDLFLPDLSYCLGKPLCREKLHRWIALNSITLEGKSAPGLISNSVVCIAHFNLIGNFG